MNGFRAHAYSSAPGSRSWPDRRRCNTFPVWLRESHRDPLPPRLRLLEDEPVSVGVAHHGLATPWLVLKWPVELDPPLFELAAVAFERIRGEHEPLQGARRHRLKPGDQRQRRRSSLGRDLHPAKAGNRVVLSRQLEPELVDIELLCPILVRDRNRNDANRLNRHHPPPVVARSQTRAPPILPSSIHSRPRLSRPSSTSRTELRSRGRNAGA